MATRNVSGNGSDENEKSIQGLSVKYYYRSRVPTQAADVGS